MARTAQPFGADDRPRRHRQRIRALLAGCAAGTLLAIAGPAPAATPVLVDATTGLFAPEGIARINGDIWASDAHAGICKLIYPHPGSTPKIVIDQYCDPAAHVALTPPTNRPSSPGQFAYDAKTGNLFVGDNQSGSGGVWRMHVNAGTGAIDSSVKLVDFGATDRVNGVSYFDPAGSGGVDVLDFATKNSTSIQRIASPNTCVAPCISVSFGTAETAGVLSLAHDVNGRLYLADLSGVTSISPAPGTTIVPGRDPLAHPVAGLGGRYTALAYDPVTNGGILYAGTTNTDGADRIDRARLTTGEVSTFVFPDEGSFAGITAMAVDPASTPANGLDVLDDPCVKLVCEDPQGTARRFTVPFETFGPRPMIVTGPADIGNHPMVSWSYTYPTATSFFCALDGAPANPCGGPAMQGGTTYSDLADGGHVFKLRAGDPLTGPTTTRRFVIDTRAPSASIDGVAIGSHDATVDFSADDPADDFACGIDGAPLAPCESPARFLALADGLHTVKVMATDFVGNAGPPVSSVFRIGAPPWVPGAVKATLRGRTLRVVFAAPPGARYARFVLMRAVGGSKHTKVVTIHGGKKNIVTIVLPRSATTWLHGRRVTVKVQAGRIKGTLRTKAGTGSLSGTGRR